MPENFKLIVANLNRDVLISREHRDVRSDLVNIPDIHCVSRSPFWPRMALFRERTGVRSDDFKVFRQNPFVSDTSVVPKISIIEAG